MIRNALRTTLFPLCALIMLASAPAQAVGWGSGGGKPSMKELVPKMSDDEAYSERYGLGVDVAGGGHVGADFTITNLGWGDGAGAIELRVNMPGQKNYTFNKKMDEGEWTYSKTGFKLSIAGTTLEQVGNDSLRLRHNGAAKVDLTFKNRMPMWKPASGKIATEDGYYQFHLIAPRADVSGTVTVGGKVFEVDEKLSGYADHVATNVAPFNFAKRFSRMRNYNGDVFVIWREITLADDFGGNSVTWVMVGYKDKIVFSDASAGFREGRIKQDAKAGYRFPMTIQIDGRKGKDSIKLVMKGKKYKRKDLLDSYGDAAKAVAGAFTTPIRYDVDCSYTLQMTIGGATAQVKGESHFVIDQLN